jgi:hypothetical protein
MIAVTKRNEKIACTRVTRRILIEVTVTSDVEIVGRGPSRLTRTVSGVHLGETDQKTGNK